MSFAQQLWRSKFKSCKKLILKNKRPSLIHRELKNQNENSMNQMATTHSTNSNIQISQLSYDIVTPLMRIIMETRLSTIEQRTQQILQFMKNASQTNS